MVAACPTSLSELVDLAASLPCSIIQTFVLLQRQPAPSARQHHLQHLSQVSLAQRRGRSPKDAIRKPIRAPAPRQ